MNIKQVPAHSNNYEKGRRGKTIKWIIMHWIVGTLQSADATFKNPTRIASAHFGIGQNEIHQYVNEGDTAYHSGNFDVNLQSIGLEHEGGPNLPITDNVYKQSAELVAYLCKKYSIPFDRVHIRKHGEIKPTQCPGTLDIDKVIKMAKELNEPQIDYKSLYEATVKEKNDLWKDKDNLLRVNREIKQTLSDIIKNLKTE